MDLRFLVVVPAYGRDYNTKAQALADWNAGKDFEVRDYRESGYINKAQQSANMAIVIRYSGLRKSVTVKPS